VGIAVAEIRLSVDTVAAEIHLSVDTVAADNRRWERSHHLVGTAVDSRLLAGTAVVLDTP